MFYKSRLLFKGYGLQWLDTTNNNGYHDNDNDDNDNDDNDDSYDCDDGATDNRRDVCTERTTGKRYTYKSGGRIPYFWYYVYF